MNQQIGKRLRAQVLALAVVGACAISAGAARAVPGEVLTPTHGLTFSGEVSGGNALQFNDLFSFDTGRTAGTVDFHFSDLDNIAGTPTLTLADLDKGGSTPIALTLDKNGRGYTSAALESGDTYSLDVSGFGKHRGGSEFKIDADMSVVPGVPEPSEWVLLATGAVLLGAWSLRRKAKSARGAYA